MSHLYRFLREDAVDYVEFGFTQFTLGVNGSDWTLGGEVEEWLAWRDEQNRRLTGRTAQGAAYT